MGTRGPEGPAGPAGPIADHLLWMDATGKLVDNSFVGFQPTSFVMKVIDTSGVFFSMNPLNGAAQLETYNSSALTRFYLAPGCVGPAYVSINTAPNVAFRYDGRVVAMPIDVEVALTVGSFAGSGCTATNTTGTFVRVTALEALPTIAPPVIGVGPFHVERM